MTPPLPPWQGRLAGGNHVALYALMVGMPILGWLVLSAAGKPIPFFGAQLPAMPARNIELAGPLNEVHETLCTVGWFLIGRQALAALFHHFVIRDNTLARVLPGR